MENVGDQHIPDYLRVRSQDEVTATLGQVRRGLEALYASHLRGLYLFGSYARGEAVPGSDLDVLVVLDRVDSAWAEIERSSHLVAEISLELGVTVSLLFRSEDRWREADTPLVRNVRREGMAA